MIDRFKVLGKRVLVRKLVEKETTTSGGILLPGQRDERSYRGEVLAIGDEPIVHATDIVAFSNYAGTRLNINGEELLIVRNDDILGVDACTHSEKEISKQRESLR